MSDGPRDQIATVRRRAEVLASLEGRGNDEYVEVYVGALWNLRHAIDDLAAGVEELVAAATEVERLFYLPDEDYTEEEGGRAFKRLRVAVDSVRAGRLAGVWLSREEAEEIISALRRRYYVALADLLAARLSEAVLYEH